MAVEVTRHIKDHPGKKGIIEPRWLGCCFCSKGNKLTIVGGGRYEFAYIQNPVDDREWKETFQADSECFRFHADEGVWEHIPCENSKDMPHAHAFGGANCVYGAEGQEAVTIWFGGTYAESYNTAWLLDIPSTAFVFGFTFHT